ncbi:MAG: hemin uptake protein HemP [Planctomycetota bacterium]|nr:hemin uptake protein HemP [Planctomycetota bacterium]
MHSPGEAAPKSAPTDVSDGTKPPGGVVRPDFASQSEDGPILSESLLRGRNEVQILHRGELYRLCLTRAGKLILHK